MGRLVYRSTHLNKYWLNDVRFAVSSHHPQRMNDPLTFPSTPLHQATFTLEIQTAENLKEKS